MLAHRNLVIIAIMRCASPVSTEGMCVGVRACMRACACVRACVGAWVLVRSGLVWLLGISARWVASAD